MHKSPEKPIPYLLPIPLFIDAAVQKAGRKLERERKKADKAAGRTSETLLPASETTAPEHATIAAPEIKPEDVEAKKSYDADSVFASLKDVKIEDDDED